MVRVTAIVMKWTPDWSEHPTPI